MNIRLNWMFMVAVTCVASLACGTVATDTPAINLLAGYTDGGQVRPSGDETVISFSATEWDEVYQSTSRAEGVATYTVSSGAFVGNYLHNGIVTLKFKLNRNGYDPANLAAILLDGKHTWVTHNLHLDRVEDGWECYTVGFKVVESFTADQWKTQLGGADRVESWEAALLDVKGLGLTITPEKIMDAQEYRVKDFVLVDKNGMEYTGQLSDMLKSRFGAYTTAEVGAEGDLDDDHDGASNLEEALTGTDANDPNDVFAAEVVETVDEEVGGEPLRGVRIRWQSAKSWNVYKVYRSNSLTNGFEEVTGGNGLTAAGLEALGSAEGSVAGNSSTWLDKSADPDGGPYFYKVIAVSQQE